MKPTFETAAAIVAKLRAAGHQALLAGGCVRDKCLNREPKDFDIATSATPAQVQALFPRNEAVGAQFGVILVIENGSAYEVATFRQDLEYKDGRRPEGVAFSNPQEDAQRRDFTVNGMFLDPATGEILDFVGGKADLKDRLLRCIGDPAKRFEEDKLRVLRAVRFAAELDFTLDPATVAAIERFAPEVTQVSWERLAIELGKLLLCPERRRGVELLERTGLLHALLPELEAMKGCSQPAQFHPEGDVWVHTLMALDELEAPGLELAWATLLHDAGKPSTWTQAAGVIRIRFNGHEGKGAEMAELVTKRFKLSKDSSERIRVLVADHLRLNQAKEMKVSTLKRLFRAEHFAELLQLHRADCLASHKNLELYDFCRAKMEEFEQEGREETLRPAPLLTGEDLKVLGFQPGPKFKEILTWVENEQLEGRLKDKQAALDLVKQRFL